MIYGEVRAREPEVLSCDAWCAVCHGYRPLRFVPGVILRPEACALCGLSTRLLLRDPAARPQVVH